MNKTILITGASRGIGNDLAICYLENGNNVIGTNTKGFPPRESHNNLVTLKLDLSNNEDIVSIKSYIEENDVRIDVLINNAGIGPDLDTMKPDLESFESTMSVNVTGTTFLTESLLPYVVEGGKVINISSKMGSINACNMTDSVAYRMSKAALNMYTKILTNRLEGRMSVAAIHPGWVKTDISENSAKNGRLTSRDSARRIFTFIESDFKSGVFWNVESSEKVEW